MKTEQNKPQYNATLQNTPMPTVGQYAYGLTSGGVNYGHGVVSITISNRPVYAAVPSVHVAAHLANATSLSLRLRLTLSSIPPKSITPFSPPSSPLMPPLHPAPY